MTDLMFDDLEETLETAPVRTTRGRITDPACACQFCLAGKARITLQSAKTGERFTYRVKQVPEAPTRWFVSLLSGPDNGADYAYMALLVNDFGQGFRLRHTAKSRVSQDALSWKAFAYFAQKVLTQGVMPEQLEVYHEGKCGRCGRALTVPESIERGIGPECATRM